MNVEMRHETAITLTLMWLSLLALVRGDLDRAQHLAEASMVRSRSSGSRSCTAVALYCRAMVALHGKEYEDAERCCRESLQLLTPHGAPCDIAGTLVALSGAIAAVGDLESAALLLGAAQTLVGDSAGALDPLGNNVQAQVVATVQEGLGSDRLDTLMYTGGQMTTTEACRHALSYHAAALRI